MKFLYFFGAILFLIRITHQTCGSNGAKFQYFWYINYQDQLDDSGLKDYHIVKSSTSTTNNLNPDLYAIGSVGAAEIFNYKVFTFSNDNSCMDVKYFNGDERNKLYLKYTLNTNHDNISKKRPVVIWDFNFDCSTSIASYKLKYFICNNDAQTYYNSLNYSAKKWYPALNFSGGQNVGSDLISQLTNSKSFVCS